MPKLPRITPRKLMAALIRQGFFIDRQRGSHAVLKHADGRMTVIPSHARDIPQGTLKGILDDLKFSIEDLIKFL